MNMEELLKKSTTEDIYLKDFENYSRYEGIEIVDSFNKLSLLIARKFDDGEMSYENGDFAMNGVWGVMLDYIMVNDLPVVEPCYEIYCAFDEGEYDQNDGADPVIMHTEPAIKKVLKHV